MLVNSESRLILSSQESGFESVGDGSSWWLGISSFNCLPNGAKLGEVFGKFWGKPPKLFPAKA
jgi:hypothetical protein